MRILYATDGSPAALRAAETLAQLPLEADSTITVLTVSNGDHEGDADDWLRASRKALAHCTATVQTELRHGHPAELILDAADELQADLIVLGSKGKSAVARFLIGSVAERVARHAPCSVLVVRPEHATFKRAMLGLDTSDEAAVAACWLRQFPLPAEAEVSVVTFLPNLRHIIEERVMLQPPAVETPILLADWLRGETQERLDATVSALEAVGICAASEIRAGDPAYGLLHAASDEGVDLVILGSGRHGAIERFFLESVSDAVLRHARCSVLLIRSPRESPACVSASQPDKASTGSRA